MKYKITTILFIFIVGLSYLLTSNFGLKTSIKILAIATNTNIQAIEIKNQFPKQITIKKLTIRDTNTQLTLSNFFVKFNHIADWLNKTIINQASATNSKLQLAGWPNTIINKLTISSKDNKYLLFSSSNKFDLKAEYTNNKNWQLKYIINKISINNKYLTTNFAAKCNLIKTKNQLNGKCKTIDSNINQQNISITAIIKNNRLIAKLRSKNNNLSIIKNSKSNVSWQMQFNNINQLFTSAHGSIISKGSISNKQLLGSLQALDFSFNKLAVKKASINITPISNQSNFQIKISKINYLNHIAEKITATVITNNNDLWPLTKTTTSKRSTITNLLILTNNKIWQLIKPIQITFNDFKSWSINTSCMHHNKEKICFKAKQNLNNIAIQTTLQQTKLNDFNFALPTKVMSGTIEGAFNINNNLLTQANLKINNATILTKPLTEKITNIKGTILTTKAKNPNVIASFTGKVLKQPITAKAIIYQAKNLSGKIQLTGNNLTIMHSPTLTLIGSPIININFNKKILIDGKINFSNIKFNPNKIITKLPDNTTIIGKKTTKGQSLPLDGEIYCNIPKPIHTKIYGIKGQLSGKLKLIFKPSQQVLTLGTLSLNNPKHISLTGLAINSAKIFYNYTPIDSPHISLDISRVLSESWQNTDPFSIASVTVGVKVYGNLMSPYYHYYSTPVKMENSQILASLVSGNQTNVIMPYQALLFSIGVNDDDSLLSSANTLKAESHFPLFDNIQFVSNEDLNNPINSTDNNDTSLLIRKKLFKRTYLNYLFSLVEDAYEISLHTKFKPNIYSQLYKNNISSGINILKFWQ